MGCDDSFRKICRFCLKNAESVANIYLRMLVSVHAYVCTLVMRSRRKQVLWSAAVK